MIIKYTTKRDANGNRYTLIIDTDKKTIKRDYNTSFDYSDYITITKKDRRIIFEQYTSAGYTSI